MARDKARIPYIMVEIEEMWRAHPDLRLGQLIMNAVNDGGVLYYLEDEELLMRMRAEYENFYPDGAHQVGNKSEGWIPEELADKLLDNISF